MHRKHFLNVPLILASVLWLNCSHSVGQSNAKLLQLEQEAIQKAVELNTPAIVQLETFGGLERVDGELVGEGPTTGTIISSDGWIISSLYSFRQQPASILVALPNGTRVPARIVARDFSRELALLKVDSDETLSSVTPVLRDELSNSLVGTWCVALGKTYDRNIASQSMGIVSAIGRAYGKAIQTDAKISPVNYGGPLIDLSGRTLGILAPVSPGTFFDGDSSDLYDSGIGFAIPLVDVLERFDVLRAGQSIKPGKLGVVTSSQNELVGPIEVVGAMPGSPAGKAGVKEGDILVRAQGKNLEIFANLKHALAQTDAGMQFEFSVERDGEVIDLECELSEEIPTYRRRFLGVRLSNLVNETLKIENIDPDTPASRSELKPGQVIEAYNGQPVSNVQDLDKLLSLAELDSAITLTVREPDNATKKVDLQAQEWPFELSSTISEVGSEPSSETSTVDVNVGDFPNKAFAIVPAASTRRHGLLILFPEPGEQDRKAAQEYWADFASKYGWIVAFISSSNPQAWSREELELAGRVLGRLNKNYEIDPRKTVFGGYGIGGRMALLAANMQPERVAGVMLMGTKVGGFQLKQRNFPLKSLDYLLIGNEELLNPAAKQLRDGGYAATVVNAPENISKQWSALPKLQLETWLEGLGRL